MTKKFGFVVVGMILYVALTIYVSTNGIAGDDDLPEKLRELIWKLAVLMD